MKKTCLKAFFFFRRQKICWVGSLEKLKINYVRPKQPILPMQLFLKKNPKKNYIRLARDNPTHVRAY